jgi:hypothetical protein
MIPVYQTIFGNKNGNCVQACVASILELPLSDVPHFLEYNDWWEALNWFLGCRGMYAVDLMINVHKRAGFVCRGYHLINGPNTRNGVLHAVVGKDGRMVHDPFPGGLGLKKIDTYTIFAHHMDDMPKFLEE